MSEIILHLLVRHPDGPITGTPFMLFNGQFQAPGSGHNLLVACMPHRNNTFQIQCTDAACLVTCEECKKTKHYKDADKAHPGVAQSYIPPQVISQLTGS